MCEKQWELAWVLGLEEEYEVEGGGEFGRLLAVAEEGVVVGSPVRVE